MLNLFFLSRSSDFCIGSISKYSAFSKVSKLLIVNTENCSSVLTVVSTQYCSNSGYFISCILKLD